MDFTTLSLILAWFIQMGIHEGSHAYAASACGDDTAYLLGKRTFDPFKHINWNEFNSIAMGVGMPIITAMSGNFALGMAWVPVNPLNFRAMRRDSALVAAAGPISNFLLAGFVIVTHGLITLAGLSGAAWNAFDDILYAIYKTSLLYGIFNLMPIPPLDGSRILYYFLPMSLRSYMDDVERYGFLILVVCFWILNGGVIFLPFALVCEFLWLISS